MTLVTTPPSRNWQFYFYATGPGGDSTVVESISPGRAFVLEEVRVVLSTSHASAIQVACRLSGILGAAYGATFFSYAIQNLSNYFWQPSHMLYCLSGDEIIISMIVSAANVWSVYASGWAVVER